MAGLFGETVLAEAAFGMGPPVSDVQYVGGLFGQMPFGAQVAGRGVSSPVILYYGRLKGPFSDVIGAKVVLTAIPRPGKKFANTLPIIWKISHAVRSQTQSYIVADPYGHYPQPIQNTYYPNPYFSSNLLNIMSFYWGPDASSTESITADFYYSDGSSDTGVAIDGGSVSIVTPVASVTVTTPGILAYDDTTKVFSSGTSAAPAMSWTASIDPATVLGRKGKFGMIQTIDIGFERRFSNTGHTAVNVQRGLMVFNSVSQVWEYKGPYIDGGDPTTGQAGPVTFSYGNFDVGTSHSEVDYPKFSTETGYMNYNLNDSFTNTLMYIPWGPSGQTDPASIGIYVPLGRFEWSFSSFLYNTYIYGGSWNYVLSPNCSSNTQITLAYTTTKVYPTWYGIQPSSTWQDTGSYAWVTDPTCINDNAIYCP